MRIVIFDIDDTISYESEFLRKNAPAFLKKELGIQMRIYNKSAYSLDEIYNLEEYFKNNGLKDNDAKIKAKEITDKFWNHYFIKYNFSKARSGVKELISEFRKLGYEVHLVSLRGKKTCSQENLIFLKLKERIIYSITKLFLMINGIKYDQLRIVKSKEEKLDYIKNYNPYYYFDDQIDILEKSQIKGKKICISNIHNEHKNISKNIEKISSFSQVLVTNKNIQDDIKIKNTVSKSTYINKVVVDYIQFIIKELFKYKFIWRYCPIVIGQEKIPSKEGLAFVGNHRDKLDPIMVSIYSKRIIHWAALLRMFQGKEDIFSTNISSLKCKSSANFIKAMGALPIARSTDDNYIEINIKTINKLTDFLTLDSSIGFFPEGTINRDFENINILPLKSIRVFRMVQETDGYIIPFSIVWIPEKIHIKNRLIIIFFNPINTYGRNKKEIKDIWNSSVNEGIIKSNEFIKKCSNLGNSKADIKLVRKLISELKNAF